MKERIICPAIRRQGILAAGWSHQDITNQMAGQPGWFGTPTCGFITTSKRFVGRRRGMALALAAEQVPGDTDKEATLLHSGMLALTDELVEQGRTIAEAITLRKSK